MASWFEMYIRVSSSPPLANISRVDVIKILGVTVTNTLSVHEHVSYVISSCSQSVHALRILRSHGMTAASVHIISKSVVVAKLVYAASSWWGFATADDRKRLQAVIRRGIRSGLCEQHHKTVEQLVEEADDKLFTYVKYNKQHVLHSTLPGTMDTKYNLRPRPHNFKLTTKNSSVTECDYITRMLFKDVYGLYVLYMAILCISIPI